MRNHNLPPSAAHTIAFCRSILQLCARRLSIIEANVVHHDPDEDNADRIEERHLAKLASEQLTRTRLAVRAVRTDDDALTAERELAALESALDAAWSPAWGPMPGRRRRRR